VAIRSAVRATSSCVRVRAVGPKMHSVVWSPASPGEGTCGQLVRIHARFASLQGHRRRGCPVLIGRGVASSLRSVLGSLSSVVAMSQPIGRTRERNAVTLCQAASWSAVCTPTDTCVRARGRCAFHFLITSSMVGVVWLVLVGGGAPGGSGGLA
jgi:hypothetical protein